MYVQPNTIVELFEGIGITANYDDTLYFSSVSSKDAYFDKLPKIATLNDLSYSRQQRGFIRTGRNIKDIYNASYMRFKNSDFENKWFYAFITSVEYIANGTTQINFEVDAMMSWMGAFGLDQCFVERQHTESDGIGENIADEGLNFGDYVIENWHDYTYGKQNMWIFIVESTEKGSGGGNYGGVYQGCKISYFGTAKSANEHLSKLISENKSDNIVNIFMCPTRYITEDLQSIYYREERINLKPYISLDGYIPKNKKLFTYPYKYCEVNTCEGDRKDYKYEYFNTVPNKESSGSYSFIESAYVGASVESSFTPLNYKMQSMSTYSDGSKEQFDERCSITNFPMCSWNVDTYKAYTAQVNANLPISIFNSFAQGAINTPTIPGLGFASAGASIVNGLKNSAGTVLNALAVNSYNVEQGTRNQGNQTGDLLSISGNKGYRIYEKCITKNYASMIDDYFTAFGYAVRNIQKPNMNARPHWTYVKTIGCIASGKVPADDLRKIEDIFNHGCRFWKDHREIGHFNLDNSPS